MCVCARVLSFSLSLSLFLSLSLSRSLSLSLSLSIYFFSVSLHKHTLGTKGEAADVSRLFSFMIIYHFHCFIYDYLSFSLFV